MDPRNKANMNKDINVKDSNMTCPYIRQSIEYFKAPSQVKDKLFEGNKGNKVKIEENIKIKEVGIKILKLKRFSNLINPEIKINGKTAFRYLSKGLLVIQKKEDDKLFTQ